MNRPPIRLLLVDGPNVLRRVFEAQPDGEPQTVIERAVSGAMGIVQRCRRELEPSHLLVAFDGEGPGWRHELYPDYKGNRPPAPDGVPAALSGFDVALRQKGYATVRMERTEADDLIASAVHHLREHAVDLVIVSSDQGFAQLLADRVRIYHHPDRSLRDRNWLQQRLGVEPAGYPALQALAGNPGDNYPGVPGIGPKRAAALLARYPRLEDLPDQPGDDPLLRKLANHRDELGLYLSLATLRSDIRLGFNLQQLRVPEAEPGYGRDDAG